MYPRYMSNSGIQKIWGGMGKDEELNYSLIHSK